MMPYMLGQNEELLTDHHTVRDLVHSLLLGLIADRLCPETRARLKHATERYKDKHYNLDPFETEDNNTSDVKGTIDGGLHPIIPGVPLTLETASDICLIQEVKPLQFDLSISPNVALDVDRQIRRRANAAEINKVATSTFI
jgi:hypothetical protein